MESFDHKRLGRELGIFHFDDRIGRGLPLWLPNGIAIKEELEKFVKELEFKAGYSRVASPHLARESLYHESGHLPYYADGMYPAMKVSEGEVYRLRPMNCPHHHVIFSAHPRSYRDLPVRLAELGQVYRLEASGALSGLLRVRGLCQNDAHIYCRKQQVKSEIKDVLLMHFKVNEALGIDGIRYRLSLGDRANKEKYVDNDAEWEWSESLLREVLVELNLNFEEAKDEAAFYGPKIDLQLVLPSSEGNREESFSTVQLDFSSAERMDLKVVGSNHDFERPYIIHRAPLGSLERLMAFLLEKHAGACPSWLAPISVCVLPVSEAQNEYSERLVAKLRDLGIRSECAQANESLKNRLRLAHQARVPNVLIIGQKEASAKNVMLRKRRSPEDQELMSEAEFISWIQKQIHDRISDL